MFVSRDKYICGLDIGSQKIKAALLRVKAADDYELAGLYAQKTFGFKDFSITDIGEFTECIHSTLEGLTKKAGAKIKEASVAIGGELIEARQTETAIPLMDRGNKIIVLRDVRRVNKQARMLSVKMDETILHDLSKHYVVDDVNIAVNPVGLYGRKLGVRLLMVVAETNRIRNMERAVTQAGVDINEMAFSSSAACHVVLSEKNFQEGSIVLDVGAKTTTILFFKDRILQHLKILPFGGDALSKAISNELELSLELAEEIKINYSSAINPEEHGVEEILIKREHHYVPIQRQALYHAISTELERQMALIQDVILPEIAQTDYNDGLFFIGGGALLPGLIERLGVNLNMPSRLAQIQLKLPKSIRNVAVFSPAIGCALSYEKKTDFFVPAASQGRISWMQEVTGKFKEFYHEYF